MEKKRHLSVGVIDYNAGNICSLLNAFDAISVSSKSINASEDFSGLTHLVLPGVGAFAHCYEKIINSGLLPKLQNWVFLEKKPILGICVGMQLMASSSQELGFSLGLDWCGGEVLKFIPAEGIRVPHVGWNNVIFQEDFGEFKKGDNVDFYFDHSFMLKKPTKARSIGICNHGENFCAVIRTENIVATQFHPEKSQSFGLKFLRSFLSI